MSKTRKELLVGIKSIQRLMPGKEYDIYTKLAEQKHLDYIPPHRFLPSMDDKSPKSLNDIELSVLTLSKKKYIENIFTPIIVEKQPQILVEKKGETKSEAIDRWTDMIKKIQTVEDLKAIIEKLNYLKSTAPNGKKDKKSFWQKLFS